MKRLGRRDFLIAAGVAGGGSLLALSARRSFAQAQAEIILGGGGFVDPATAARKWVFAAVDLATGAVRRADMAFLPHGIAIHPGNRNRLFVFEKIGPGACEIDLASLQVVRPIPVHEGHAFYGHGAVSADGKLLFSTETRLSDQGGVIAVRDSASLEYRGEFPSHGDNPHECRLIDAGRVMVITNGGGTLESGHRPSLTYIDVRTRKLLRRLELTDERFNAGHVAVEGRSAVVVSAPRRGFPNDQLGAISVHAPDALLKTMAQPDEVVSRMQGEALSVAIHRPSGVFGVTHPDGNMVTFWTLQRPRLVKVLDLQRPRGIALTADGSRFIISYGPQTGMVQIPASTLVPDESSRVSDTFLGGSHIVNWTRERS